MGVKTGYPHIVLDEERTPMIEGTTLKVIELVVEKLAYGWSAEELHLQHPYLTLGQIHAALAYYWDHAEQLDEEGEKGDGSLFLAISSSTSKSKASGWT